MAVVREDPGCEGADDLQACGGRVDQDQLGHHRAEPREPVDQLRRVGRSAADDCDFHPLNPVNVMPCTNARWAKKKMMISGAMASTVAAVTRFQSTWWTVWKDASPSDSVHAFSFSLV